MEATSNPNSFNNVETDNRNSINVQLSTEEQTRDDAIRFAGTCRDIQISFPPHFDQNHTETTAEEPRLELIQDQILYQCSSLHRSNSGSGSDSAIEEGSPYASFEALVPSSIRNETSSVRYIEPAIQSQHQDIYHRTSTTTPPTSSTNLSVRGTTIEESTDNYGFYESIVPSGTVKDRPKIRTNPYEDIDARLATFMKDVPKWPHKKPSMEEMAAAGMIFLGSFKIKQKGRKVTVNDMVECHKCRGRMCQFSESDDPTEEHTKLFPDCN